MGPKIELDLGAGDDFRTVAVSGTLDLSSAPKLASLLAERDGGEGGLLVDLSECTFVDSTVVSLLLNASRRETRHREGMAVVCSNPTPLRVFQVTGTVETLNVVEDRDEAVQAIARARKALAHARPALD